MLRRLITALIFLFLCTGVVRAQAPIAYNDTVTVVQFSTDTINLANIDSSTSGDSLCLFKIYGSHNFALVNCSDVVYHPDTTFTGWDSCHYIICNAGDTLLCDTAVLVVNVTTYYRPFMLRNSKWVVEDYGGSCVLDDMSPQKNSYDSYATTDTDTLINGEHYYALYDISQDVYQYNCYYGVPGPLIAANHYPPSLIGYLRQDTISKQVFLLYPTVGHDSLLFDFDLSIGDSIILPNVTTVYLQDIDYFQSGGVYYRRYDFLSYQAGQGQWIEGIGSFNGLLNQFNFIEAGGNTLLCFSNNDTVIYPGFNPDSTCANGDIISSVLTVTPNPSPQLFPNPANNTVTITGLKPRTPIILTNLLGQVLVNEMAEGNTQTLDISHLAAGMYFVNNMKLVKE